MRHFGYNNKFLLTATFLLNSCQVYFAPATHKSSLAWQESSNWATVTSHPGHPKLLLRRYSAEIVISSKLYPWHPCRNEKIVSPLNFPTWAAATKNELGSKICQDTKQKRMNENWICWNFFATQIDFDQLRKGLCLVLCFPLLATKLNLDLKSSFPIHVLLLGRKKHSSANLVVADLEAQVNQTFLYL